jgi:hypothetical protein
VGASKVEGAPFYNDEFWHQKYWNYGIENFKIQVQINHLHPKIDNKSMKEKDMNKNLN